MAEDSTPEHTPARSPEEVRPPGQASVAQMLVIGAIASVLGILFGLLIDWFPTAASTQADQIDTVYDVLIIASVPMFVLVTVVVLFSVWKFRQRPGEENADGPPIHGNTRLEVIWTAFPAILMVGLCTYAYIVLRDIEDAPAAGTQELRVEATGQQFTWTFRYLNGEARGLTTANLMLQKDRPVKFEVKSRDVIHDLWVPEFRMKIDAVPGITTSYRVTPNREGSWSVVCAELCGLGHATMRNGVRVVSADRFRQWVDERRQAAAGGGAGGGQQAGGEPDGKAIFTDGSQAGAAACGSCHALSDAGTSAQTGPDLDEALKGAPAEEIRRGIVEPNAEITQGFQPGIMPQNYGETLSQPELDALVEYLERVAGK